MKKEIELVLIHSSDIQEEVLSKLRKVGVKTIEKENINLIVGSSYYKNVLLKLYVFELEGYDRIVYMDGDSIILQNG